jgi:hypothetical protein
MFSEARGGEEGRAGSGPDTKSTPKKPEDDENFIALRLPKGKAVAKGRRRNGPNDSNTSDKKKAKQK